MAGYHPTRDGETYSGKGRTQRFAGRQEEREPSDTQQRDDTFLVHAYSRYQDDGIGRIQYPCHSCCTRVIQAQAHAPHQDCSDAVEEKVHDSRRWPPPARQPVQRSH